MTTLAGCYLMAGLVIGAQTMEPDDGLWHLVVCCTVGPALYVMAMLLEAKR